MKILHIFVVAGFASIVMGLIAGMTTQKTYLRREL